MSLLMHGLRSLLVLVGCGCAVATGSSPSTVSRAQLYRTGDLTYDQFFLELHAQQAEASSAPEREQALRTQLGRLTESREPSPEALAAKVRDRVQQLAARGTRLGLRADLDQADEDATVELAVMGTPADADRPLLEGLERTLRGELALAAEMARRQQELGRLEVLAQGLERSTDRAFGQVTLGKMPEVARNLEDSRIVILVLKARSEAVRMAARRMLKQLVRAATLEIKVPEPPPTPAVSEPPEP
jgi:hypothetical protein